MSIPKYKEAPPELTRIARRRISDDVYDQIREAILERTFQPGERLSIPDLARRFDVSQMPVRQAVGRLHDEGLVDVRPRSGTFVAQAEERDIAETFDIRRALERLAAESAVVNASEATELGYAPSVAVRALNKPAQEVALELEPLLYLFSF